MSGNLLFFEDKYGDKNVNQLEVKSFNQFLYELMLSQYVFPILFYFSYI